MTRVPRLRPAAAVGAVAVAALVVLSACGGADPPGKPPASVGAAADRPVPAAISDMTFTTSTGAQTSLRAFRGKVVVLTDFLTLCGEQCPMTSANINRTARLVDKDGLGKKVVFVEFSVDPQRDTPARLAAYRTLYGPARNWLLLTTTPARLKQFCAFFGIYYKRTEEDSPPDTDWLTGKPLTYDVAHQDAVLFLDANGHERFAMLGDANTQGAALPSQMKDFLDAEGRKNLEDPGPMSWTVPQALRVIGWLLGESVKT